MTDLGQTASGQYRFGQNGPKQVRDFRPIPRQTCLGQTCSGQDRFRAPLPGPRTAQHFALFCPSPATILIRSSLSWGSSRGIVGAVSKPNSTKSARLGFWCHFVRALVACRPPGFVSPLRFLKSPSTSCFSFPFRYLDNCPSFFFFAFSPFFVFVFVFVCVLFFVCAIRNPTNAWTGLFTETTRRRVRRTSAHQQAQHELAL